MNQGLLGSSRQSLKNGTKDFKKEKKAINLRYDGKTPATHLQVGLYFRKLGLYTRN